MVTERGAAPSAWAIMDQQQAPILAALAALERRRVKMPLARAAGRIAAETIAPAPPGVPRLVPGQRITAAHTAWLAANRDLGAFLLDRSMRAIDSGSGGNARRLSRCGRHEYLKRDEAFAITIEQAAVRRARRGGRLFFIIPLDTDMTMAGYKDPGFQERAAAAQQARQRALETMRNKPAPDPEAVAARVAANQEREAAEAAKRDARKATIEAEKAAKLQARADAEAAAKAAEEAAAAARRPPVVATAAEMKAARDARYAARKARQGR